MFANDVAANVRGAWRDAILEGAEPEDATRRLLDEFEDALADEDDAPLVWIALAAAQMETGRLQPEIRDRALSVIASGGAGKPEHLYDVLTDGHADAALVASMVHYGDYTVRELKEYLRGRGIKVRLPRSLD